MISPTVHPFTPFKYRCDDTVRNLRLIPFVRGKASLKPMLVEFQFIAQEMRTSFAVSADADVP